jgi:hypothetical protein
MMSPEAYERLRENVKGPEDLEREMQRSAEYAELQFDLQADLKLREHVRDMVQQHVKVSGIEATFLAERIPPEVKTAIEHGKFSVAVSSHAHQPDQLVAVPEGNIQERIPLTTALSDRIANHVFLQRTSRDARST